MKYFSIAAVAVTLTGCMDTQTTPLIPLDDPRRAEQDARHIGTLYGASGIAGIAFVGVAQFDDGANISYDSRYSTEAEIAAAPEKVCAYLNSPVALVRNEPNPDDLVPDFIRVLYIGCNV